MNTASFLISPYIRSILVLGLALGISYCLDLWLGSTIAVLLVLQLAVVVVTLQCGAKYAYFAAVFEALSFNFLFTFPRYSLQMLHVSDTINVTVFIIVAITTSKLAEYYRLQQDELKQTQLRNSILLSISHDLRTPLATIIGTLSTLKEYMGLLDEAEKKELLDNASSESHRLHQYIENLLQATKLQHGALRIQKTEQSIVPLLHQVVDRFSPQKQRIILKLEDDLPSLMLSVSLFEQALFNVVDNALRYSAETEPVTIRVTSQEQTLIIDIEDNGIGLSEVESKKIFDLFYSAHSPKNNDSGSGLGLVVAKGIITAHQGKINALPKASGSVFRIQLPFTQGDQFLVDEK